MSLLTLGTFDVPHMGHAYFLGKCAQLDKVVLVGVNSDEFVEQYKGAKPLYSWSERAEIIGAMGYQTYSNNSAGRELILALRPNIVAIGMDWYGRDYEKQIDFSAKDFEDWNITLVFIPNRIMSTTSIKERLS